MKIKYRVELFWKFNIRKIEIEKETNKFVWFHGVKQEKKTKFHMFFDTFSEAKEFLISKFENKVLEARRGLELANAKLGNVKGLKELED